MACAIRIASCPSPIPRGAGVTKLVYLRFCQCHRFVNLSLRPANSPRAPPWPSFCMQTGTISPESRELPYMPTKAQRYSTRSRRRHFLSNIIANLSNNIAKYRAVRRDSISQPPPAKESRLRLKGGSQSEPSRRSAASYVNALRVISVTLVNPHNVRSRAVLKADWRCCLGVHIGGFCVPSTSALVTERDRASGPVRGASFRQVSIFPD